MKRSENKVAVLTGASKGIGAAIAKQHASEGASVAVTTLRAKKARSESPPKSRGKVAKRLPSRPTSPRSQQQNESCSRCSDEGFVRRAGPPKDSRQWGESGNGRYGGIPRRAMKASGAQRSNRRRHSAASANPKTSAPAVAFFASPDAAWITGETLTIAGCFH